MNTRSRDKKIESLITEKVSQNTKSRTISCMQLKDLVLHSLDLRHICRSNVGCGFGVKLERKGPHDAEITHHVRIHCFIYWNLTTVSFAIWELLCYKSFPLIQSSARSGQLIKEFGALAQLIGRGTVPFLLKYVVSAAKLVSLDVGFCCALNCRGC